MSRGCRWTLVLSLVIAGCPDHESNGLEDSDAHASEGDGGESARPDGGGFAADDAGLEDAYTPMSFDAGPLADGAALGADDATLSDGSEPLADAQGADASDACASCAPRAGFALSTTTGSAPLSVVATSSAQAGSSAIAETTYDWGEGDGLTPVAHHRYGKPGTYTVAQYVRDVNGLVANTSASVVVAAAEFTPVRFSASDRSNCVATSSNGYQVEFTDWGPCGVRSDGAVLPGSGVFYFEGHRFTSRYRGGGFGVATPDAPLREQVGSSAQSMGVLAWGPVRSAGGVCSGGEADSGLTDMGMVVDYRGSTPVIHVLQQGPAGGASVRASCTMSVSAPLHIFYSGDRSRVGYELRLNTGADTTNVPFRFSADEVRAALTTHGDAAAAAALVQGFGKTRAPAVDTPPTLTVPDMVSVTLGQAVTLDGQADDVEDGPLSNRITWVDLATQHHAPVRGTGKSFSFTPATIGRHPVLASVEDADGLIATKTVMVRVTGTLPQYNPVQLTRDPLTGPGITLSADALSASFNGTSKDGIRANQGIYGRFWYFEVHRDSPIRNMGMGLVIGDGALNPYEPLTIPWSCSLNVMRGFWVNLLEAGDWSKSDLDTDYGFAVDYRAEHPTVYIIIRGELQGTLLLDQVWVPLYPMLYGNPPDAPVSGMDMTLNFGTKPFAFDPRAILTAKGVDASALELGWGLSVALAE